MMFIQECECQVRKNFVVLSLINKSSDMKLFGNAQDLQCRDSKNYLIFKIKDKRIRTKSELVLLDSGQLNSGFFHMKSWLNAHYYAKIYNEIYMQ